MVPSDQAATGRPKKKLTWINWENARGLSFIPIIIGTILLTRPPPPDPTLVEGTYVNACCRPIILKDGTLHVEGRRLPYKVRMDKNGYLEADIDVELAVDGGHVVVSAPDGASGLGAPDLLLTGQPLRFEINYAQPPHASLVAFVRR